MQALLDEIARMPDSALRFARGVSEVRTPEHLVDARRAFLANHQGDLGVLFGALRDRFPNAGATINCFYAAADAALMAQVDSTLTPHDRTLLRQLWEASYTPSRHCPVQGICICRNAEISWRSPHGGAGSRSASGG